MSNKNSKIKFNVIDFIIIIAIIGCVAGVAIRYDLMNKIGLNSSNDQVKISFLIMGVRPSSADAMKKGDVFYWKQNGMIIGTLEDTPLVSHAESFIVNDKFEWVKAYNENRADVRGTFISEGAMTADGFMLNGTQFIAAGKNMMVQSKNITVTLTVTDIQLIK